MAFFDGEIDFFGESGGISDVVPGRLPLLGDLFRVTGLDEESQSGLLFTALLGDLEASRFAGLGVDTFDEAISAEESALSVFALRLNLIFGRCSLFSMITVYFLAISL